MMKTLFTILISFLSFSALAQVPEPAMYWIKGIGGYGYNEVEPNVTKTSDGGFIINIQTNSPPGTGNIDSFCTSTSGDREMFLKYNSDASILEWSKCTADGYYIYPIYNGDFIFGNLTTAVPSGWAYKILRENDTGLILWTKTYGGQAASARLHGMVATDDGGYIMVGETNYTDTDFTIHYGSFMDDDMGIVRVDSNGSKIWAKVIGGSEEDATAAIVSAPGDGCYILGSTSSNDYDCTGNHGNGDIYLARLDKNGNILWHRDIGGSGGDGAAYGATDGKGGILIAGASSSLDGNRTTFPSFGCPIWALEVDSNMNILWNNCYGGGGGNCYPNSICKATDGSIWIAGVSDFLGYEVDTNYGLDDAWFVHADSIGNFLDAKVMGSHQFDRGEMVYPLSNGNVIAGGFYDTAGGSFASVTTYYSFPNDNAFLTVFAPWETGIKQIQHKNNLIKIFPNPASEHINIEIEQLYTSYLLITDIFGRQVFNTNLTSNIQINVKDWQKGMYIVETINSEGYREIQKLIVK